MGRVHAPSSGSPRSSSIRALFLSETKATGKWGRIGRSVPTDEGRFQADLVCAGRIVPVTGDGDPLASGWISSVVALEIKAARGRPKTSLEIRWLIRDVSLAKPLWGAPRIMASCSSSASRWQTTVAKYMAKRRKPPSQGWKTVLRNHRDGSLHRSPLLPAWDSVAENST